MKLKQSMILILIFIVISLHCDTTEPPIKASLSLTLEDVSCTEVWLTLKSTNLQFPNIIAIKQNDQIRITINLASTDTLLYIDSLLPKQTYKFQSVIQPINQSEVRSNELSVATMDTTSHNFTWQTFTFGERISILYDVTIIDENNIWAVGEIYMNDSLGQQDPTLYNIVKWNGVDWKVERVYYDYQGSNFISPLRSILAFSTNDIWVGSNQPMHWNGNRWEKWDLLSTIWNSWINKIWGSSNNDIYIVGNSGNIAHYNGSSWTKIESGATTDLMDVYGDGENVFICGYKDFKPTVLLKYKNGVLTKIIEEDQFEYKTDFISGWVKSVWVKKNKLFSLTFYDLYRSKSNTKGEGAAIWKGDINTWGSNGVRGNDVNDIFTTGYNGFLWHYNGIGWKRYEELVGPTDPFYSLSVKGNIVVLAGERYLNGIDRYALIVIGKR